MQNHPDYSSKRPQMFDKKSRSKKAIQILSILKNYYQSPDKLKRLDVLDIGCSTGIIANALVDNFHSLAGIDIDQAAINYANTNFNKPNLKFKSGDILDKSLRLPPFDLIICHHIYEHVPDSQKLFNQIHKLLKPGAICYLAAVNKYWPLEPHYNLPFLSFLPKSLANLYLKTTQNKTYYENLKSYWQLKKEVKNFKVIDYTPKILSNPKKYGYSFPRIPKLLIISLAKFTSPTFIWILKK